MSRRGRVNVKAMPDGPRQKTNPSLGGRPRGMLRRTYYLGVLFGAVIAGVTVLFFQDGSNPFTSLHLFLLLLVSCLPGFGCALFLDPYSKEKKEEYLKIDFYRESD